MGNITDRYRLRLGRLCFIVKRRRRTLLGKDLGETRPVYGLRNYRDCRTAVLHLGYVEISLDY